MTVRGVFAVDRGVFDHPAFAPEPFTEREAWLWMVGAAAWCGKRVRVGRSVVDLQRGQLAFSERFMAVKWRWSKSRVHRFLHLLKIEAMTDQSTDHETNLITICNYDKYAFDGTSRRPQIEPQTEPLADQPRTKEKELKKRKGEDSPSALLFETASRETSDEADLFQRGKKILGTDAGGLIARLLKSKKGSVPLARAAIEQASTKESPREYIGAVIRGPVHERHGASDPAAGII